MEGFQLVLSHFVLAEFIVPAGLVASDLGEEVRFKGKMTGLNQEGK